MVAHHCSIIYEIAQSFGTSPLLINLKTHLFVNSVSSLYSWTNWSGFLLPSLLVTQLEPLLELRSLLDTENEDEGEGDRSFKISADSMVLNGSISTSPGRNMPTALLFVSSSLSSSFNLRVEDPMLLIVKFLILENLCFKLVDRESKNRKHWNAMAECKEGTAPKTMGDMWNPLVFKWVPRWVSTLISPAANPSWV